MLERCIFTKEDQQSVLNSIQDNHISPQGQSNGQRISQFSFGYDNHILINYDDKLDIRSAANQYLGIFVRYFYTRKQAAKVLVSCTRPSTFSLDLCKSFTVNQKHLMLILPYIKVLCSSILAKMRKKLKTNILLLLRFFSLLLRYLLT